MTDDAKPLPTLAELFTGPFKCRCGAAIDHWGSCPSCWKRAADEEHARLLAPARESIPERFRWASFERPDELREHMHPVAVRRVGVLKAPLARGIALVGESGAGKTTLACALLRRIHDSVKATSPSYVVDLARSARFVDAGELQEAWRELQKFKPDPKAIELISTAQSVSLLVVDNVEPGTFDSAVGSIVMKRHNAQRACTIVTTWMPYAEAAKHYGGGWARRAFETVIELPTREEAKRAG